MMIVHAGPSKTDVQEEGACRKGVSLASRDTSPPLTLAMFVRSCTSARADAFLSPE